MQLRSMNNKLASENKGRGHSKISIKKKPNPGEISSQLSENLESACPHCGTFYELPRTQLGQKAECGQCDNNFIIEEYLDKEPEIEQEVSPKIKALKSKQSPLRKAKIQNQKLEKMKKESNTINSQNQPKKNKAKLYVTLLVLLAIVGLVVFYFTHRIVNLARNASVEVSGATDAHPASQAVDGVYEKNNGWMSAKASSWISFDLSEPVSLGAVRSTFAPNKKCPSQYSIDVSLDAKQWTRVVDLRLSEVIDVKEGILHKFEPVVARFVRVQMRSVGSLLTEFEIYKAGRMPTDELITLDAKAIYENPFAGQELSNGIHPETLAWILKHNRMLKKDFMITEETTKEVRLPDGSVAPLWQFKQFLDSNFPINLTPGNGLTDKMKETLIEMNRRICKMLAHPRTKKWFYAKKEIYHYGKSRPTGEHWYNQFFRKIKKNVPVHRVSTGSAGYSNGYSICVATWRWKDTGADSNSYGTVAHELFHCYGGQHNGIPYGLGSHVFGPGYNDKSYWDYPTVDVNGMTINKLTPPIMPKLPTVALDTMESHKQEGARYIRIELPGDHKILSLSEVQVFNAAGVNLALTGVATQSSTSAGGIPKRAIDGKTSPNHSSGTVSHTASQKEPWWEVDLGQVKRISSIVVWNRGDGLHTRLNGFKAIALNRDRKVLWSQSVKDATEKPMVFKDMDSGKLVSSLSFNKKALQMDGVAFDSGIGVRTDSKITYTIPKAATRFVAVVGVDDNQKKARFTPSAIFEVYCRSKGGNWKLLARTPEMNNRAPRGWRVDVKLQPGFDEIQLVTHGLADWGKGTNANWCNAGFIK